MKVLNLVINGLPSIPESDTKKEITKIKVLNLVINGLPSIQFLIFTIFLYFMMF